MRSCDMYLTVNFTVLTSLISNLEPTTDGYPHTPVLL